MQTILVIKAPIKDSLIIGDIISLFMCGNIMYDRSIPYLPSFSNTAAKIIDPATGASTCALGSHKCTEYIGSFTINAIISIIHPSHRGLIDIGNINSMFMDMFRWFDVWYNFKIIDNNGSEAATVYINKYILAWDRSGWYPHNIIIIMIGINEASNII